MGIFKQIKSLDSTFSWSFFGFLIGILGVGYAIYIDQFKEEKPNVIFDILSNTQVLAVKENLNKLDIIYDGQNLKEKKENLILLTVRISNEGNEDIRESDFYSKSPFGLKIKGGKIVDRPILIDASNKILKDNLIITYDSLNRITINKIPFNQDQFFTLKVLTICNENTLPSILPMGNITGINNEFQVKQSFKNGQKEEKSFFQLLTFGSFGIHVARFFFYILCILAFAFLIGIPMSKLSDSIDEIKKKRKIQKFREKTKIELSEKIEMIFDIYKFDGEDYIKWLNRLVNDNEKLKNYLNYFENRKTEILLIDDYMTNGPISGDIRFDNRHHFSTTNRILKKITEKKLIIIENEFITIDAQFKTELNEFNYFIDIQ